MNFSTHSQINYTKNQVVISNCYSIEFYNQGTGSVLIKIGGGIRELKSLNSVTYGNDNLNVIIETEFEIEFLKGDKNLLCTREYIKNECTH